MSNPLLWDRKLAAISYAAIHLHRSTLEHSWFQLTLCEAIQVTESYLFESHAFS